MRPWLASCLGLLVACSSDGAPLTLLCGAASKPAIERIVQDYEQATGERVEVMFGGSGTLLSQLTLAGKGDLYLPGSHDFIERALATGQIVDGSQQVLAYLVPALLVPEGNPAGITGLEDLARPGLRVGIGNPETVCLGQYAVEILEHNDLLEEVMPNVVAFGASCSGVVDMPVMGSVDAALSWGVTEAWNPQRLDSLAFAPGQVPRISTVAIAISAHSSDPERAQRFIDHVRSPVGLEVYRQAGYITDRDEALARAPGAIIGGDYELPDDYLEHLGAKP